MGSIRVTERTLAGSLSGTYDVMMPRWTGSCCER
jgi:hypothetical protein